MTAGHSICIPHSGKEETPMRKQLLCAAALGLTAFALPAAAQDSESVVLNSSVPAFCQATPFASGSINVGDITGPLGFVVTSFAGTPQIQTGGNYYCNAPATVTLSVAPLTNPQAVTDVSSFVNRVDFRANLVWDNVTGSANSTDAGPTAINSAEANTGVMTLSVSDPSVASGDRPIAGAYTGAVTLTVALNP